MISALQANNKNNFYEAKAIKNAFNENIEVFIILQLFEYNFDQKLLKLQPISNLAFEIEEMYNSSPTLPMGQSMQKVEIFLAARNLQDKDFFSKSDPYVKVYFKRGPGQKQLLMGKTETVNNNLNPNFNTSFKLDYIFQAHQQLRFQIYDFDDGKNDDYLGSAVCSLGAIAGAKNQTLLLDVKGNNANKGSGKFIVRLQPTQESNIYLQMQWRAVKLMNTDSYFDFWNKSDPYLKFMKIRSDNSLIQAGRTQVIKDNLSPTWKPVQICLTKLIHADSNSTGRFKVQCWDWQEAGQGKHQFIGQTILEYSKLKQFTSFPLQIPLSNKKHKNPGKLVLQSLNQKMRPTFMDYLRGGLQLNLSVAIDFTGSNGLPTHPNSLHYMDPMKPNQYQTAINAVSSILLNYDTDKRIPCFGFGGKPHYPNMYSTVVNHCFPLSGNPNQLQAYGLEHLMQMYKRALMSVQLAGPTWFSGILQQAIQLSIMNAKQGSNTYQILLILTDGQIHDMQRTIDLLVQNCNLPLSLIIVGVGNADFTNMNRLDGDNGLYSSKGRRAARDIVQFVPFRDVGMNPDLLAQELLAELPNQVVQYMGLIGKLPNPPMEINFDNYLVEKGVQQVSPQEAMQNQVTNMFQQANFFGQF